MPFPISLPDIFLLMSQDERKTHFQPGQHENERSLSWSTTRSPSWPHSVSEQFLSEDSGINIKYVLLLNKQYSAPLRSIISVTW